MSEELKEAYFTINKNHNGRLLKLQWKIFIDFTHFSDHFIG